MTDARGPRLSLPRVLAFSSLSIPLAGVGLPLAVYLAPLYANEVGLGLELTGFLFMVLRFWDVLTDPIMGYVVDRYRSPWGRVRHWMVLSVPLLGLATYFVYMPERGAGPGYFVVWMLLFYVGFTLLQTARSAWVPAIAVDYDDRSRFFTWAEVTSIVSMLALLAVPAILAMSGVEVDRFGQVAVMGWALLISLPIVAFLSCAFVPDRQMRGDRGNAMKFDFKAIVAALKNRYLGSVLLMELLVGTAIAITASNYLFVAEYAFGLSDSMSSIVLMIFFSTAVAALPFWLKFSARTEKHTAFLCAVLMGMSSYVIYYFAARSGGGFGPLLIGALVNGAAFSAPVVIARSMAADVVEYQAAKTGENRAGIYYSVLTSVYKVGNSLAFGIGYFVLGRVAGFRPGVENSPEAIHGLIIVFCLLPMILYGLAAIVASRYTLTRSMQLDISKSLDPRGPEILD